MDIKDFLIKWFGTPIDYTYVLAPPNKPGIQNQYITLDGDRDVLIKAYKHGVSTPDGYKEIIYAVNHGLKIVAAFDVIYHKPLDDVFTSMGD